MHHTAYRKHFVWYWRKHPVPPMTLTVTPHLSPIREDTLRCKTDAPVHHEP